MAKEKTVYTCSECGGTSTKWLGKCTHCNAWNTLIESIAESSAPTKNRFASLTAAAPVQALCDIEATDIDRTPTGQDELDRVLGGGIVEGGVVLIGGDPGIGKSTLLLQALDTLQRAWSNDAGPPQGAKVPSGGREPHKVGERGGHICGCSRISM
jgi:DNA repair protein RadA/Sms